MRSLSFKSERVWNFEISYCWFVPDVMAAMLVVSRLGTKLHFHVNFFLLYWPSIWPPGQVVPSEEFVVFQSHEMLRRPLLIYLNCLCSLCLPFSFCLRGQSSYGNESIGRSTSPDALIRIVIWIKMSVAFLNSTIICILSTRGGVCECETNKSTVTRIF